MVNLRGYLRKCSLKAARKTPHTTIKKVRDSSLNRNRCHRRQSKNINHSTTEPLIMPKINFRPRADPPMSIGRNNHSSSFKTINKRRITTFKSLATRGQINIGSNKRAKRIIINKHLPSSFNQSSSIHSF
ncbi:hypothetical protein LguiB_030959 [Lonicera macranthoides]